MVKDIVRTTALCIGNPHGITLTKDYIKSNVFKPVRCAYGATYRQSHSMREISMFLAWFNTTCWSVPAKVVKPTGDGTMKEMIVCKRCCSWCPFSHVSCLGVPRRNMLDCMMKQHASQISYAQSKITA